MKKALKWIGIGLGGLVGLLGVELVIVYAISGGRMNKTYAIELTEVDVLGDAETLAWGDHVTTIRGCRDCHGQDLGGTVFLDDPAIGTLNAGNLTPGIGGIAHYSDAELVRAIRHGVDETGQPLLFMPSNEFYVISDEDLGAMIAYLRSLPALPEEPK